ncbi:hypothetical protein FC691_30925 [Bacillus cereus]|nr:hypothetical protein FC691_30925 [Bacillus cereus]
MELGVLESIHHEYIYCWWKKYKKIKKEWCLLMADLCRYEECHSILRHSRADEIISNQSSSINDNLLSWIETTTYDQYAKSQQEGLRLDVIIPVEDGSPIPLGFGHTTDKKKYETLQEHIRSGRALSISRKQAGGFISRIIPSNVYDNWLKCMETMISSCSSKPPESGIQQYLDYINASETLATINYVPINSEDSWPTLIEDPYVPDIVEWKAGILKKGDTINNRIALSFVRVKPGNGTVLINTNKGPIQIPITPPVSNNGLELAKEAIEEIIEDYFVKRGGKLEWTTNRGGTNRPIVKELKINHTEIKLHIELVHYGHLLHGLFYTIVCNMHGVFDLTEKHTDISLCIEESPAYFKNYFGINGDEKFCVPREEIANAIFNALKKTY